MSVLAIAAPFGIYIHWPYCARICPYCDFNVYKSKQGDGGADLTAAIKTDLAYWRELSGPRALTSVHFGGGTPSLMSASQIADILSAIDRLWGIRGDTQIALEANPSDSDADKWKAYASAGIGRLSLGVQSFDDRVLSFLGRDHDGTRAAAALEMAMPIFNQVSADMIFGHKDQTLGAWHNDLMRAVDSGAGHLSCYQLTIEQGTAFAKASARGDAPAVDSDASADLYDMTRDILAGAGFDHYEISNFAKNQQDSDNRSLHNLVYWRGGDYVGVGPGAHGRIISNASRLATVAHMRPAEYIGGVAKNGHGLCDKEILTPEDHGAEYVMMGLRITEGISLNRYKEISGRPLSGAELSNLTAQGLLRFIDNDRITTTQQGRPLLDSLTRLLLTAGV